MRSTAEFSNGQSNLANGDIALLSYSPGGSMHREVGPGAHLRPSFWGKWRSYRRRWSLVSDGIIRKSDSGFLGCPDHCAISNPRFCIECLRSTNQQELGHFGAKFEEG